MISIVAGYFNRKNLFYETLKSISKSKYKDIEFIAVDDGSSPDQRIDDFYKEFPFLKVIRIEPQNKWYINPCVPFNVGLREAKGDIIVLQNPECLHVHDVLTYVSENINDSKYITLSAYGLNPQLTNELPMYINKNTVLELFNSLPQQVFVGWDSMGWYNHSKYRPACYHFCSAITRNNMSKLNGFDERYGNGIGFDDNEILVRIHRLGLKITIEDNISVIHQYHTSPHWFIPGAPQLTEKNRRLLMTTMRESRVDANTSKLWK